MYRDQAEARRRFSDCPLDAPETYVVGFHDGAVYARAAERERARKA
jgi:hypothetical protein